MQKHKSKIDSVLLVKAVETLSYEKDGSGIDMAITQSRLPDNLLKINSIKRAVDEIAMHRQLNPVYIMINRLPAGITVPKHRDWVQGTRLQPVKPRLERWHLPIATNEDCSFWDEKHGVTHMKLGVWYGPIPYWKYHYVYNVGVTDRVHLVVDLDCSNPVGDYEEDLC